jgi:hypothetical protein
MKKLYVTKYALTQGIELTSGKLKDDWFWPDGSFRSLKLGRDCFLYIDDALKDAEKRREKKILSLKNSIGKLKQLKFDKDSVKEVGNE